MSNDALKLEAAKNEAELYRVILGTLALFFVVAIAFAFGLGAGTEDGHRKGYEEGYATGRKSAIAEFVEQRLKAEAPR